MILFADHPVYVSIASSGADGDSCPVNMEVRQTHTVSFTGIILIHNVRYSRNINSDINYHSYPRVLIYRALRSVTHVCVCTVL